MVCFSIWIVLNLTEGTNLFMITTHHDINIQEGNTVLSVTLTSVCYVKLYLTNLFMFSNV